jgi:hypothetical protein
MAPLLTKQSSITANRLPTKENKCQFSVSIRRKQKEVYRFRFSFAENKWKLLFSVFGISEK